MDLGPQKYPSEEVAARVLIEKKTVINLLEAFAVAVKHYVRISFFLHNCLLHLMLITVLA
jgi:hypothetical protein